MATKTKIITFIFFVLCIYIKSFADENAQKIIAYLKESNAAYSRGNYKESCEFAKLADEMANVYHPDSAATKAASAVKAKNCKAFEDQEKRESESITRQVDRESQEKRKFCNKYSAAYAAARNDCATANNFDRCMDIKLGSEAMSIFKSCDFIGWK